MSYDIDSETYAVLYSRYMNKEKTGAMLDLAGDLKGKRVVDLCCGGGRLAIEAANRGASHVWAIDESERMLYWGDDDSRVTRIKRDVDNFFAMWNLAPVDVIFCKQAVNYWFKPQHAALLKRVLAPGSKFIFNTFHKRPPEIPLVKSYYWEELNYTEVSWSVANTVKHVQIAEGFNPHFTQFNWIPPEVFDMSFRDEKYSDIHLISNGSTDIYVVTL